MFVLSKRAQTEIVDFVSSDGSLTQLDDKKWYERICIDEELTSHLSLTMLALLIAIGASGGIYIFSLVPWCQQRIEKFKDALTFMIALTATTAMWLALLIFYNFRKQIDKHAGDTNNDHDWSFGQIIGLCTFAPIVAEFLFVLVERPRKALTGTMSKRYEVRSVESWHEEQNYQSLEDSDTIALWGTGRNNEGGMDEELVGNSHRYKRTHDISSL